MADGADQTASETPEQKAKREADTAVDKLLDKLATSRDREKVIQSDNRIERAIDEDFEDNDQWQADHKAEVEARGQAALVYNEIKPTIEWLLGTEKRARADWKIVPRSEDDVKPAQRKTKLFKYVSDINSAEFQRSLAFADAVRSGDGWIKIGVKRDESAALQIEYTHCNWREFRIDSRSRKFDGSDARYLHRDRYVDVDDLVALHPKHEEAIRSAAKSGLGLMDGMDGVLEAEFDNQSSFLHSTDRQMVLLCETWYREPRRVKIIRGEGEHNGKEYVASPALDADLAAGGYEVVSTLRNKVFCALWIEGKILYQGESPYKHGLFPYVRVLAYRKKRNGQAYGVIRALRDPQEDLNKRMSKAQFALSVRRVMMEKGAVDDKDELAEEVARPDGIIEYVVGKKIEIHENGEVAQGHLDLAMRDTAYIRQSSGVLSESRGLESNATSKVAIDARAEHGSVVTTTLFDNLRQANLISGRIVLSLIEQFMTEKQTFRITGERGKDEFVTVNDGDPDNDITRQAADFTVSEQDWRASTRQSMAEELIRVAGTLPPEQAMMIIAMAIEMMDFQGKEDAVKHIRKASNIPNPDATEEELAADAEREQAAGQMQQQAQQVEMAGKQAKAQLDAAKAALAQAQADREKISALRDKLSALATAVQTSAQVVQNPALARAADEMLAQIDSLISPGAGLPDQSQMGTVTPPQLQQVAGA